MIRIMTFTNTFTRFVIMTRRRQRFNFQITISQNRRRITTLMRGQLHTITIIMVSIRSHSFFITLVSRNLDNSHNIIRMTVATRRVTNNIISQQATRHRDATNTTLSHYLHNRHRLHYTMHHLPNTNNSQHTTIGAMVARLTIRTNQRSPPRNTHQPNMKRRITIHIMFNPTHPNAFRRFRMITTISTNGQLRTRVL